MMSTIDFGAMPSTGWGNDTISDFEVGIDKIDFSGLGLSWSNIVLEQAGEDAVISILNDDGSIVLHNTETSNLSHNDFIL